MTDAEIKLPLSTNTHGEVRGFDDRLICVVPNNKQGSIYQRDMDAQFIALLLTIALKADK